MTNRDEKIEPVPEEGTVLKTEGEDSARAYVASAVPEGTACPTIEVDRVRVLPPSCRRRRCSSRIWRRGRGRGRRSRW